MEPQSSSQNNLVKWEVISSNPNVIKARNIVQQAIQIFHQMVNLRPHKKQEYPFNKLIIQKKKIKNHPKTNATSWKSC